MLIKWWEQRKNYSAFEKDIKAGELLRVALRLSSGIDVNKKLNRRSKKTALMLACYLGHTDIVQILLDQNADPYATCKQGFSSLAYAIMSGNIELLELMRANKINMDLADSTVLIKPLMLAKILKHEHMCDILQNSSLIKTSDLEDKPLSKNPFLNMMYETYVGVITDEMSRERINKAREAII